MIYCPICSKRIPTWAGMYAIAPKLIGKNAKGELCHKSCLDMNEKDMFARAQQLYSRSKGKEVQRWIPNDIEALSGTELGRLRRGRYSGYVVEQETK